MEIKEVKKTTPELMRAMEKLIPQLNASIPPPTEFMLQSMLESDGCYLVAAYNNTEIIGILTLVTYQIPTGKRAWIEDVVVDESARNMGIGKQLLNYAIGLSKELKANSVNLTSSSARVAANQLYQSLGFELRETNVYRISLG